jgi:16S rRNA (adenine(1408)-N(1))-methyltransferase
VLDLGTGDGAFVYQSAREDPSRFYVGLDAEPSALQEVSARALRKPAKGGLPNALFLRAAVEALPPDLSGVANEVHIHFPWGSLLHAVLTGDLAILHGIRGLCAPGALLEVVWALDFARDRAELARLGILTDLPEQDALDRYKEAGFDVEEAGTLAESAWPHLQTSWARRLQGRRKLSYLIARAV